MANQTDTEPRVAREWACGKSGNDLQVLAAWSDRRGAWRIVEYKGVRGAQTKRTGEWAPITTWNDAQFIASAIDYIADRANSYAEVSP